MIKEVEATVVIKEAYCDKCGARIVTTGEVFLSHPPRYGYKCSNPNCDQRFIFDEKLGSPTFKQKEIKKFKIIALIGESGCGKDTLMKSVLEEYDMHEIISHTTRPAREGEIDGKNYHFVSKTKFFDEIKNNNMLETSVFNNWMYGTHKNALDINKTNIGVFNPEGIRSLLNNPEVEVTVVRLQAGDKTRLMRQLNRELEPNVEEIIRRYSADKADFSKLNFPYIEVDNETFEDYKKAIDIIGTVNEE